MKERKRRRSKRWKEEKELVPFHANLLHSSNFPGTMAAFRSVATRSHYYQPNYLFCPFKETKE